MSEAAKVLVTGATGLIGRHAVGALRDRGFEVHAAARGNPVGADVTGVGVHAFDLFDPDACRRVIDTVRPSHLLHLAWVTDHGEFWQSPKNQMWLDASRRLVDMFAAAGGSRIVAAGTCAEYDWTDPAAATGDLDAQHSPIDPATPYGKAKAEFHHWLSARDDLDTAWGRVFFVYGPGEDIRRLIPSVALALLAGQPAAIGPGTQVRDFIDGRDAAALFAALVDSPLVGPVNVSTGRGLAVKDLAQAIAKVIGHPELLRVGALPARLDEPPRLVGAMAGLRASLGMPEAPPLEESLAYVIDHLRGPLPEEVLV